MTFNKQSNIDNIILNGVVKVVSNKSWSGTMTQLTKALSRVLDKQESQVLPGSPAALRIVINRVVNRIRNRKIGVKFVRTHKDRLVKFY